MSSTMQDAAGLARLRELPRSERRDTLTELVVDEFKASLMMTAAEDLPTGSSYFELGFTSLLILEVKERLETLLGHPISANTLFNQPTVDRLVDHLAAGVLADLFDPTP